MTETEWLTSNDVVTMLLVAEGWSSYRERGLFLLECARQLCELLPNESGVHGALANAYEVVECDESRLAGADSLRYRHVVGAIREQAERDTAQLFHEIDEARSRNRHVVRDASRIAVASSLVHYALSGVAWWRVETQIDDPMEARRYGAFEGFRDRVCCECADELRCIVGNPFQRIKFKRRWRTEHTVGIAAKMYDDRDFAAMPILADALEEAGCDSEAVLTHCREPGPHARGCWVVDDILGKR